MAGSVYINVTVREEGVNTKIAKSARDAGYSVVGVHDLDEFRDSLVRFRDFGTKISKLGIFCHGSPGKLYMMGYELDYTRLPEFTGFEGIFEPDARVHFYGCNVAKGEIGRMFLLGFAKTFLLKAGGRVCGWDQYALAIPGWTPESAPVFGNRVTAFITKGGNKSRIAVGNERANPLGQWKVTLPSGDVEFYWFQSNNSVAWEEAKVFGDSGKGNWSTVDDELRIAWESGSRESWYLPLFDLETTGIWYRKDSLASQIRAEKILDTNRILG